MSHTHNNMEFFDGPIHHYPLPVPNVNDQLPVYARVGRGIQGNSYKVDVIQDTDNVFKLMGGVVDSVTGDFTEEWRSDNISGGKLEYSYNLNPYTDPKTFTITFRLNRPGRTEWQWTTPAIPYVTSFDNIGPAPTTLYVKKHGSQNWVDKLVYPEGTSGADYGVPDPLDPWSVNLTYGSGGDIDVPSADEIATALGITVSNLRNMINGQAGQFNGADNVKDYVDKSITHFHNDLGFDAGSLAGDGGTGSNNTVKKYIDNKISSIIGTIINHADLASKIKLLSHPVGSTYIAVDGTSPATLFGGTWTIVSTDRYLKASSQANAGHTNVTDGIADTEIDSYLDNKNTPMVPHEHLVGITTNARCWMQENGGDQSGAAYMAGLASPGVGYGGRIMISVGSNTEPPNGSNADATRDPNNPFYHLNDRGQVDPYVVKTGGPSVDTTTMRTRINTPKYISVVVWKRTA